MPQVGAKSVNGICRQGLKGWLLSSFFCISLFAGLVLVAPAAAAQEFAGRVTDSSGAVIPKATVTVTNQGTAVVLTTLTTGSGDYNVPYLKPGKYTVSVLANGFTQEKKTDITLQVGQTAVINFDLKPGTENQTVTVVADQSLLAGRGDVGEVIENRRVTELPLTAGNAMQLAALSAGASLYVDPRYQRPFDDLQADLSINGGGTGNSAVMLDGVSNEAAKGDAYNGTNGQIGYIPPAQSVAEFKIITNPYDAQYGRSSGGVIDMTLKSGTNTYHGAAYEFHRENALDANTWVANYSGIQKLGGGRDQWGGEMDGPLVIPKIYNGHDKTFFLAQYENYTSTDPGTVTVSVPDPAWINGDFSATQYYDSTTNSYKPLTIYDPTTLHDNGSGVLVRDPFPGNKIPSDRINKIAQNILSYFPAPNVKPAAGLNSWNSNYTVPQPLIDVYRNALGKLDHNFSDRDRITLRYGYWERFETRFDNGITNSPASEGSYPHAERSHTVALEYTHTFTPNLLFNLRGSAIRRTNIYNDGPANFPLTNLGFPSDLAGQLGIFANHFPQVSLSEFTNVGNSGSSVTIGSSLALLPTITWIKGKHAFHFGLDIRLLQSSAPSVSGGMSLSADRGFTQAAWNQGDAASGLSVASFLLGTPSGGSVTINPTYFNSQHYYAPFLQDDWRITQRLTLNLGIRYDLNLPPVERHNQSNYTFDTTTTNPVNSQVDQSLLPNGPLLGGMTFVGVDGNPKAFYAATLTNVQPRFGFAFQVDNNTVLHGGFGIMYRNPSPGPNRTGFSRQTQFVSSTDGGKTPVADSLSNPFPTVLHPVGSSLGLETSLGQGLYFINPKYRSPQFQTFSIGMQHRFAKATTLEINYVGTRTYHNDSSDNINRISVAAYAQCNILLGGDPARCDSAAGSYVTSPFYNVAAFQGTAYYSSPTIQAIQLTRPFPQFSDVTEYQLNNGRSWYNAMQVTGQHKLNDSLTLHGTWTWSKTMNSGGYRDQTYRIPSRSIDSSDVTHRITLSAVWYLPVGRGREFGANLPRAVDLALGGWELASIYTFRTGYPWTTNGSTMQVGPGFTPQHSDSVVKDAIRGVRACTGQYSQQPSGAWALVASEGSCGGNYNFISTPRYAPSGNIIYTGVRDPGAWDWDANLSKNIALYERLTLQMRLEAFNVDNHADWAQGYNNNPLDSNFGLIVKNQAGQSNQPRQYQFGVKLLF